MFVDAHLHMTDPEFDDGYDDMSDSELLFSNCARPSEYYRLKALSDCDRRVIPFYGTHPWYASEYDEDTLEDMLKNDNSANVGEIGLDKFKGTFEDQLPVFQSQLGLTSKYDRIASIHMVGHEDVVLSLLRKISVRSILHSFSGPVSYIKAFTECGCYFSISPRIFSKPPDKVRKILTAIPKDRLLLETDAPSNHNNCVMMSDHAGDVGNAIGMTSEELIKLTSSNANKLLEYQ